MHVPFCVHKCHYCDFYSIVDNRQRQSIFVDRLVRDIEAARPWLIVPLVTIFVGGGTPTLLETNEWKKLGDVMRRLLPVSPHGEFTVEANPETVTRELADVLVAVGVNRVSIGAQSFNPQHLRMLERQHDPANVDRSVATLRSAGIRNINIDLIFGIPGQTLAEWRSDLDRVLALEPEHMSCYGLTYEPNTPMTVRLQMGQFERIDEALEAQMYELTMDTLASNGYEHYEISNWAKPGRRCRHNLAYWRNENWWALGPSASGHMNGVRWKNIPRLGEYLDHAGASGLPPVMDIESLDADGRAGEKLMLQMRLLEGIAAHELDPLLNDARRSALRRHRDAGLLEEDARGIRLSRKGLLLADTVLADLI